MKRSALFLAALFLTAAPALAQVGALPYHYKITGRTGTGGTGNDYALTFEVHDANHVVKGTGTLNYSSGALPQDIRDGIATQVKARAATDAGSTALLISGMIGVDNDMDSAPPAPNNNASYRTLMNVGGSHTAARVAGTYAIPHGDALAVSGTGTLYPLGVIQIVAADLPTINGITTKLRIRAQLYTNDVAPTGNYTFGLYPITRPATSGGAGLAIFTLGTVVTGSNGATFTAPAADLLGSAVGVDFALPADGAYVIGVVTTATVATSAHVHVVAQLQMRNN